MGKPENIQSFCVIHSERHSNIISYRRNTYIEIHPNALAMELIKIITAKIGQRYWIMM